MVDHIPVQLHIPTKEATLSGAKKPPVPIQKGQPFRSNEASRYGYWLLSGGAPALSSDSCHRDLRSAFSKAAVGNQGSIDSFAASISSKWAPAIDQLLPFGRPVSSATFAHT
jgi:hypothetical protein